MPFGHGLMRRACTLTGTPLPLILLLALGLLSVQAAVTRIQTSEGIVEVDMANIEVRPTSRSQTRKRVHARPHAMHACAHRQNANAILYA